MLPTPTPTGNNSSGIVFDDKNGTVYGSVTLQENITIDEGESLTIPDGASLNTGSHEVIVNGGTLTGGDKITGTVKYAPAITTESLPNGTVNEEYSQTLAATGSDTITWSLADGSSLPAGLSLNGNTITGTPTAAGTSTFTVKAENSYGSDSKQLSITIDAQTNVPVTGVSLDQSALTLTEEETATLTATVQPSNATNKGVTWKSSDDEIAKVDNGVVTAVAPGTATITVTTADGNFTATCAVTVEEPYTPPPYIPPTKTPSQQAIDKIEDARPGDTVKITLRTGQTKLDKEVFEELAGRDVTLEISLPGGVTWTVNGEDIPKTADLTDLDMGVSLNTSTIPVDLINTITGEIGTVQLTLKHDGPFGFTMTLTAPVGKENEGLWANLYHYDEDAGEMAYQTAALVDEDGNAALPFDHASQYAIVIDEKSHQLPFEDVASGSWYEPAVRYVYTHNIMKGMSATTFVPNKSLTRAEAVQVLYNLEGQPETSGSTTFPDLVYEWYKPAISWAEQTGVVDGYEDGTFRPDEPVTRQEFAQMLYNYASYKDYDLSAQGDLTAFPDGDSVQEWAIPAMAWANGNELINGHDDGTLEPGGTTTRAQAASILMRFDLKVVKAE